MEEVSSTSLSLDVRSILLAAELFQVALDNDKIVLAYGSRLIQTHFVFAAKEFAPIEDIDKMYGLKGLSTK